MARLTKRHFNLLSSGTSRKEPTAWCRAGRPVKSPTLSHDEHKRVVELCIETAAGRVPVIAGAGSNSTREAIELTQHAQAAGANATLHITPYYNKPTQEGLYHHYKAIADAVDLPLFIYNIPGRSVVNMSNDTMTRLAELPQVIGVKDATADIARVSSQRLLMGSEFIQLSGEDSTALAVMAHGGQRLYFGDRERGAAGLRRVPIGLPGR